MDKKVNLKLNRWYQDSDGIYYVYKRDGDRIYFYGLLHDGNWRGESVWINEFCYNVYHFVDECWRIKDKKVFKILKKFAKKQGYTQGAKVYGWGNGTQLPITLGGEWDFNVKKEMTDHKINRFWDINTLRVGGHAIFVDGKWTELVDEKLLLNDVEVKIEDGFIKIGCKDLYTLKNFKSFVETLKWYGCEYVKHPELGKVKVSDLIKLVENE